MDIPKLQIETTRGQMGLQITKPVQEIQQPRASISLSQPAAVLNISTTDSKLMIDTTENRAEIEMKSVRRSIADFAQKGHQGVKAGMARRVSEGDRLMKIEHGGSPIAEIAKQNAHPPSKQLGIRFLTGPLKTKIDYQPSTVDVQITPQQLRYDATVQKPLHRYTQGKVTGYMLQKPSICIDVQK